MINLSAAQMSALAGVGRSLDRLQEAIDDPERKWASLPDALSYTVAGTTFQVDPEVALAAMVRQCDLLVQHLEMHGIGWEPTKRSTAWAPGTEWQSGTKPPSWYDQAQG